MTQRHDESPQDNSLGAIIGRALGGLIVSGVTAAYHRIRGGKDAAPNADSPPARVIDSSHDSSDEHDVEDDDEREVDDEFDSHAAEDDSGPEDEVDDEQAADEPPKEYHCHFCGKPKAQGVLKVHLHNKAESMAAWVTVPRCGSCEFHHDLGFWLSLPFLLFVVVCVFLPFWVSDVVGHPSIAGAILLVSLAAVLALPPLWKRHLARRGGNRAPDHARTHHLVRGFLDDGYEIGSFPMHYDPDAAACFYCGAPAEAEPYKIKLANKREGKQAEVNIPRCHVCHKRQKLGTYIGAAGALAGCVGLAAALKMELPPHARTFAFIVCGLGFTLMLVMIWGWRWVMKLKYGYAGEEHGRQHPDVQRYLNSGYKILKPEKTRSAS